MAVAWYLSKTAGASTNFVSINIPAPVAIAGAYDFTIGFDVQLTGTDLPVLHAGSVDASTNFYFVNSSGNLDLRTAGNTTTVTVNGGVKTDFNLYAVRHYTLAGVPKRQVFYNGELKAEYTLNNIPTAPITFLFKVGSATRTGNLKTLFFTDVNAPLNSKVYDANLSGGIGLTLPPDGTLNGAMAWVEYDDGTAPPSGTTYDAGGVSAMLMPTLGGASLTVGAGAPSGMALAAAGGVTVTANAGSTSGAAISSAGGVSLSTIAGGVSAMSMTAQGGATVESASPEITAGGVSAMTASAQGGAAVTARAGGATSVSFSWSGGAAVSADVGGVSVFTLTADGSASLAAMAGGVSAMLISAAGGATVNEQVVTVNRVMLGTALLCAPVALPPVAMLQSVSMSGSFNYRRKL
jgi:hypothetical protein